MKLTSELKNLIVVFFISLGLLIFSIFSGEFSLIIMSFQFIAFSMIEYVCKYYGYNLLGDKKYFEWIISTILLIVVFVIFYQNIYPSNSTKDSMSLFVLFYFNWFYFTNLINNFLNTRVNNYVQYD
jgi:hypothetical protein